MEMEDDNVKDIVPLTEGEVKDEQKVNLNNMNDRTVQQGYNRPYQSRRRR